MPQRIQKEQNEKLQGNVSNVYFYMLYHGVSAKSYLLVKLMRPTSLCQ
jgi:hypothetical protein